MTYPTAYRSGRAVEQRLNTGSPVPKPSPSTGGGTPANDNSRPQTPANDNQRPGKPANDNVPASQRGKPLSVGDVYRILRPLLRFGLRRVLWPLDLLDIMARVLQASSQPNSEFLGNNYNGWTQSCGLGGGMANRGLCGNNLTMTNADLAAYAGGSWNATTQRWIIGFLDKIHPWPPSPLTHKRFNATRVMSKPSLGERHYILPSFRGELLPTPWQPPLPRPLDPFVPPMQPDPDPNDERLPTGVTGALKVPSRFSRTERSFSGYGRVPFVVRPWSPGIVITINPDGVIKPKPPKGVNEPVTDPKEQPLIRISPRHEHKKPERIKEQKRVTSRATFSAINRGIGQLTEAADLIEVMYKSLPEKIQKRERAKTRAYYKKHNSLFKTRDPSLRRKAQVLSKHWKEMRNDELLKEFIKNELQDAFFGRIGRKAGEAGRAMGRPVGVGAGPIF